MSLSVLYRAVLTFCRCFQNLYREIKSLLRSLSPSVRISSSNMTVFSSLISWRALAPVVLGLMLLVPLTAHAQSAGAESTVGQEQSNPTNLPEWAAPSESSRSESSRSTNLGIIPEGPTKNAPPPPADPSRIPVDGGLSLLALAGAGYATRRLLSDSSDPDRSEDDPAA